MVSLLSASWGRAQPAVREWPDPGYRRLGVYGSGPDSYFDYQLVKLHLGDVFPEKEAYWAGLKSSAGRRNASHRHNTNQELVQSRANDVTFRHNLFGECPATTKHHKGTHSKTLIILDQAPKDRVDDDARESCNVALR